MRVQRADAAAAGAFSPAWEVIRALRQRQISAVELLELHLDRIDRHNQVLNAIVIPDFDRARAAAAAADAARARGEDGPLLGLPFTVKDCIDVEGLPGAAGVRRYAERRPGRSAPVVNRLRGAGGILIGKTNVSAWASDWQADNALFGRTNNPWKLSRTPGGSTGGGAAAVAAGLTPLELGSDIAGSIRVPAAFCGVYGHKPSETAVPRSGHFPGDPLPNPTRVMEVQGPLARSAEDLSLALEVIAGPEVGEDIAWRLELPPARASDLSALRVALLPAIPWLPVDDEIAAALDRLGTQLGRRGAVVREAQPGLFGDLRNHHRLYNSLLGAITALSYTPEECKERAGQDSDDPFERAYCRAFAASAADYLVWNAERERYRESFREFFEQWDILLTPANIAPAFPHTDEPQEMRTIQINGRPVDYYLQPVYSAIASLSGQPATAFPMGLARSGVPIGLQAVGPYLEDRTPIQLAALVGREFGGFQPPPGYEAD